MSGPTIARAKVVRDSFGPRFFICTDDDDPAEFAEAVTAADAQFIADAYTVRQDTGKTPMQLALRVAVLEQALRELLADTQHANHPSCEDGPCPVRGARNALEAPCTPT